MGQGSNRNKIYPGFSHSADILKINSSGSFHFSPTGYQFHRTSHVSSGHIIQHDNIRLSFQSFLHFLDCGSFNFDFNLGGSILFCFDYDFFKAHSQRTQRSNMIILD